MSRRLEPGKYPAELLAKWLATRAPVDADASLGGSLVTGPRPGEDTAVIDLSAGAGGGSEELLVVTSDPITFTTREMGEYAVTINANDIATAGAEPRWLFATVLLPPGIGEHDAEELLTGISQACYRHSILLAGGHTEITTAVTRPVLSATLLGTVARGELLEKSSIAPGQAVLVTKAVAIEGATILAGAYAGRLSAAGVPDEIIREAADLSELLSVLPDAGIARLTGGVIAFHDATEGGIVGALEELAGFGRIEVDLDAIPILPCCRTICTAVEIDPLGLIASGSLLIVCRKESATAIEAALEAGRIACTRIGAVVSGEPGVTWRRGAKPVVGPRFAVDEIARFGSTVSRR